MRLSLPLATQEKNYWPPPGIAALFCCRMPISAVVDFLPARLPFRSLSHIYNTLMPVVAFPEKNVAFPCGAPVRWRQCHAHRGLISINMQL